MQSVHLLERPFPGVRPLVALELDRLREGLLAEAALVGLLGVVRRPHVVGEVRGGLEDARALLAGVAGAGVGARDVVADVEPVLELALADGAAVLGRVDLDKNKRFLLRENTPPLLWLK